MIHHVEVQVLVLLLIACITGMAALRVRLPYTLALVTAGLALGLLRLPALHGIHLEPDVLLLLLLPGLLFEAAFHVDPVELRRDLFPILLLAVPGVLVAVGVTAGVLVLALGTTGLVPGFGWEQALLFSSVLAATDPISVLALFKQLGVSKRLYLLVEGESLLNDGVAVVVFVIVATVYGIPTTHGAEHAVVGAAEIVRFGVTTFLTMAVGGAVVGAVIGGAMSVVTRQVDDHLIETTLTVLVAYGSFLVAEELHASGVLSTVAAGVVLGSAGARWGMSPSTRVAVKDFWEFMAFLANSFVFLLVGLELDPAELLRVLPAVGIAFVAVLLGRAAVVYGGLPIADRFATPIPPAWRHVLWWGGLRGALSMVLVVSLPNDVPGRNVLLNLVFGVVLVSLFAQGLTAGPLLARLGLLTGTAAGGLAYDVARGKAVAARRALERAQDLRDHGLLDAASHDRLVTFYSARRDAADGAAREAAGPDAPAERLLEGVRRLADVERDALDELEHAGAIPAAALAVLTGALDRRLDALAEAEHHGGDTLRDALARLDALEE